MLGDFLGLVGICMGVYLVYLLLDEMAKRKIENQQNNHCCGGCCNHHNDSDGDLECKCGGNCKCEKDNK